MINNSLDNSNVSSNSHFVGKSFSQSCTPLSKLKNSYLSVNSKHKTISIFSSLQNDFKNFSFCTNLDRSLFSSNAKKGNSLIVNDLSEKDNFDNCLNSKLNSFGNVASVNYQKSDDCEDFNSSQNHNNQGGNLTDEKKDSSIDLIDEGEESNCDSLETSNLSSTSNNNTESSCDDLEEENKNVKSLSFWITIICSVLGLTQAICLSLSVDLHINIIVDICAVGLSILVGLGILKSKDKLSSSDIANEIKDELNKKNK